MINWLLGTPPKVGSFWILKNTDPFAEENIVEVIAVKQGWVKFEDVRFGQVITRTIRRFREKYREDVSYLPEQEPEDLEE